MRDKVLLGKIKEQAISWDSLSYDKQGIPIISIKKETIDDRKSFKSLEVATENYGVQKFLSINTGDDKIRELYTEITHGGMEKTKGKIRHNITIKVWDKDGNKLNSDIKIDVI